MMRVSAGIVCVALSVGGLSAQPAPPPDSPTLRIIEPTAKSFVVGETVFKAALAPEGAPVTSVEFFVDGAGVPACVAIRMPFECTYQAGEKIAAHTIRAVANFPDGRR